MGWLRTLEAFGVLVVLLLWLAALAERRRWRRTVRRELATIRRRLHGVLLELQRRRRG